jgi:hypothetical protein
MFMLSRDIFLFPDPTVAVLDSHTTAVLLPVLPLMRLRLEPPLFTPSIVTYCALSNLNTAAALVEPVMVVATPAAGLIVKVFVELASALFLITRGKVSPVEYVASVNTNVTGPVRHAVL